MCLALHQIVPHKSTPGQVMPDFCTFGQDSSSHETLHTNEADPPVYKKQESSTRPAQWLFTRPWISEKSGLIHGRSGKITLRLISG